MKKLLAALVAAAAFGGIVNVAVAAPGPNDNNNHGLCTAMFNGSENGQAHKRQAGPFVALETYAYENDGVDNDDDGQTDEAGERGDLTDVWNWCEQYGIGGNPDDPNVAGNEGNGKNGKGNG